MKDTPTHPPIFFRKEIRPLSSGKQTNKQKRNPLNERLHLSRPSLSSLRTPRASSGSVYTAPAETAIAVRHPRHFLPGDNSAAVGCPLTEKVFRSRGESRILVNKEGAGACLFPFKGPLAGFRQPGLGSAPALQPPAPPAAEAPPRLPAFPPARRSRQARRRQGARGAGRGVGGGAGGAAPLK